MTRGLNMLNDAIHEKAIAILSKLPPGDMEFILKWWKHLVNQAKSSYGGVRGGPARAAKLSPERRREIAQQAARARWEKHGPANGPEEGK